MVKCALSDFVTETTFRSSKSSFGSLFLVIQTFKFDAVPVRWGCSLRELRFDGPDGASGIFLRFLDDGTGERI